MQRVRIRIRSTRITNTQFMGYGDIPVRSLSVSHNPSSSNDKESEKYVSYGLQNHLKSSRNAVNMQTPTWLSEGTTHTQLEERSEKLGYDFTQPFSTLRKKYDNPELMVADSLKFLFESDTGRKKYKKRPAPGTLSSGYSSCPHIGELIKKNHYLKVLTTINSMISKKTYLSMEEFCAVVNDTVPFRYVTFQIYSKYKELKLIDIHSLPKLTIEQILQSLYDNYAFTEFEELYSVYLNNFTDTSSRLQNLALSGYIKSENIEMASELFRQIAFTTNNKEPINAQVLHNYLLKLYYLTNNVNRCYQDYRLWILKGLPTDTTTDAFVYRILKEKGTPEQFDGIKQSLKQRGRNNHLDILFVELCDKISNPKFLELFYENKDYYKWVRLIDNDYDMLDKFHDRLLSVHLDLNDYEMARNILIKTTHTTRTMYSRLFKISKKLAASNPKVLVAFIAKLLDSNPKNMVRFAPYYYELLWRSLVTKYPSQGKLITQKFQEHLILITKSWSYSLSKVLKVTKHPIYPDIYVDKHSAIFLSSRETGDKLSPLDQAERRFKKGILPTEEQIFILLKSIDTASEIERLKILVKEANIKWSKEFELQSMKGDTEVIKKLKQSNHRLTDRSSYSQNKNHHNDHDCKLLLKYMSFNLSLNRPNSAIRCAHQLMRKGIDTDTRLNIFIQLMFEYAFRRKDIDIISELMANIENDSSLVIDPVLFRGLNKAAQNFKEHVLNSNREGEICKSDKTESFLQLYEDFNQFLERISRRVVQEADIATAETDNTIKFLDQWIKVDDAQSGGNNIEIDQPDFEALIEEVKTSR